MTICIAAICDGGKHIVAAADRMVTMPPPLNLEFEPPLSKIEKINGRCVALASGSLPFADDIICGIRSQIQNQNVKVRDICELFRQSYVSYREQKIEELLIAAQLGTDFKAFRGRGGVLPAYLQPQPNVYQGIIIQSQQFNLNTDFLLAGIDEMGPFMGVISHPGTFYSTNKLGYATTGSGATHASVSLNLGGQVSKLSLEETLFSVYAAKRAAEVAPGVGCETDMVIISVDEVKECGKVLMDKIKDSFEHWKEKRTPKLDDIKKVIHDKQ